MLYNSHNHAYCSSLAERLDYLPFTRKVGTRGSIIESVPQKYINILEPIKRCDKYK